MQPGSTLWLLRHELRLSLRGLLARRSRNGGRGVMVWVGVGFLALVMLASGVPLGFVLRGVAMPMTPAAVLIADAACAMIFTLMLSQTLAAAVDALYQRADLDLLFSSPIAPRKVLTVRFLGVALSVCMVFALFAVPFILPIAVISHPAWLGSLLVLLDLGLGAAAVGLLLAAGLFRLIGPRRTRTVGQVLAAIIGAAFFLTAQLRNILGEGRTESLFQSLARTGAQPGFHMPAGADIPLRALTGEPLPLLLVTLIAVAGFTLVNTVLGGAFARDAASAAGADTPRLRARARAHRAFTGGAFAVTLHKEMRLLLRDPALMSQVLLRVLYMLPLGFILLRQAGKHQDYLLPASAAALVVMTGQVAGSLAWITISAEDAPDLLACAPSPIRTLRWAKLAAAFIPVAVLLAIVLLPLLAIAPWVGVVSIVGCVAVCLSTGLLNLWWQKPGKRADFRRRRTASWLVALAEFIVSLVIAAATGLFAAGLWWGVAPALAAALLVFALRRSDAQIARALQAA